MGNFRPATIRSHQSVSIADALGRLLLSGPLAEQLIRQAVFDAWDKCSGAAKYTLNRYLKEDALYITMSSSLVRRELYLSKDRILADMNKELESNEIIRLVHKKVGIGKIILR